MGFTQLKMVIFHTYVCLMEGMHVIESPFFNDIINHMEKLWIYGKKVFCMENLSWKLRKQKWFAEKCDRNGLTDVFSS